MKSVEELRKNINAVLAPLKVRYEHYVAARPSMQTSITDYFLTPNHAAELLEVMNLFSESAITVPVNSQLLSISFQSSDDFDTIIQQSGLGFKLKDESFYFPEVHKLRPETAVFMKQFAIALSAYRTCYRMEWIYQIMINHEHVQLNAYDSFLSDVNRLKADYDHRLRSNPGIDLGSFLRSHYQSVLVMKKKITDQRSIVNHYKESFIEVMQQAGAIISKLLTTTEVQLSNSFKEFPDFTWLQNAPWTCLATDLIKHIFTTHYGYNWYVTGAVIINSKYGNFLSTELVNFSFGVQGDIDDLKIGLLDESQTVLDKHTRDLIAYAGLNNITLASAESPTYYLHQVYALIFANREGSNQNTTRLTQGVSLSEQQFQ